MNEAVQDASRFAAALKKWAWSGERRQLSLRHARKALGATNASQQEAERSLLYGYSLRVSWAARDSAAAGVIAAALEIAGLRIPTEITVRDADRAISIWGARTTLSELLAAEERRLGEERKKNTAEVADVAALGDGELHGGDGNSGEVDAPAETASEKPRTAAQETAEHNEWRNKKKTGAKGAGRPPGSGPKKNGSVVFTIADVRQRMRRKYPAGGPDLAKALRRLFRAWALEFGGREQSPRLDGRALVREVLAKQYAVNRCYRNELSEDPVFLLMCDVSGSCSASAGGNLAVCLALCDLSPKNYLLVVHSNGDPTEVHGARANELPSFAWDQIDSLGPKKKRWNTRPEWGRRSGAWWERVLELPLAGAVNWGDNDAEDILELVASQCPLAWLDSYCANVTGPMPFGKSITDWPGLVGHWYGVNCASSSAFAIREILRETGGRGVRRKR